MKRPQLRVGPVFPHFSGQDVANGALARVIDGACLTPTELNLQTWRWVVVRNSGAKKSLESATSIKVPLSSAPVILICLADTLAWKSAPQTLKQMIDNRKITAEEGREALRKLREYYSRLAGRSPSARRSPTPLSRFTRSCWGRRQTTLASYLVTEFDESIVKTHFHIPDNFLVAALVPIGYDDKAPVPTSSKLPLHSLIYQEKFGENLPTGRQVGKGQRSHLGEAGGAH